MSGSGSLLAGRIGGVAGALVVGQFIVGLTYVVAARSMEPAGLGLVATCFAIASIGGTVFDLGLMNYLLRETAGGRVTIGRSRALVRAKRRLLPLLVVPTTAITLLIMPTPLEGVVLGLVAWAVWEAQTANSLLRALERFANAASAQLAGRVLGLATTVGLLFTGRPELALSVGLMVSFSAEAVIDRVLFLGPNEQRVAGLGDAVRVQRRSVSFGLANLGAIGQQLDTPLVAAGGGAAAGGIYAGAGRLLGPLLFLSSSLALVGAPWLARAGQDKVALRAEERRITLVSLLLALAPLAVAAAGPAVIPWLLGEQYANSGWTFAVLAVGAAFSTVNQGMAIILQNRGAERAVVTGIGVGVVIGLVTTYVLAGVGGPVWAAAGFTGSQLYMVVHLALCCSSVLRSRPASSGSAAARRNGSRHTPGNR